MKKTSEKRIIVAFHTGRGGRFNNQGHISFIGEKNYQDLISLNSEHLFLQNRDAAGKFSKPYLTDLNGKVIVEKEDYSAEVGCLDFDGEYDTDSCGYLDECTDKQLQIIADSGEYKSFELTSFLEERGFLKFYFC